MRALDKTIVIDALPAPRQLREHIARRPEPEGEKGLVGRAKLIENVGLAIRSLGGRESRACVGDPP